MNSVDGAIIMHRAAAAAAAAAAPGVN